MKVNYQQSFSFLFFPFFFFFLKRPFGFSARRELSLTDALSNFPNEDKNHVSLCRPQMYIYVTLIL